MVSRLMFLRCRGMIELVSILESASAGVLADPLVEASIIPTWSPVP